MQTYERTKMNGTFVEWLDKTMDLLIGKPLQWMAVYPSNWIIVATGIFIISGGGAYLYSNEMSVQRSGSLIVLVGVFLTTRTIWRQGLVEAASERGRTILPARSSDGALSKTTMDRNKQHQLDVRSEFFGVICIFIGTILWGYGDLIACLLFPNVFQCL